MNWYCSFNCFNKMYPIFFCSSFFIFYFSFFVFFFIFISLFFLSFCFFTFVIMCIFILFNRDSDFLSHVQLVHQFQCSLPQSRAITVEDLLTVGLGPDEAFYPAFTVLTRCAGSGCCPDSKQICAPTETRNVSLVFMVRHRIDQQRDRHHEVIHAVEHTKCACMDKTILTMKNSRFWSRKTILKTVLNKLNKLKWW